MWWFQIENPYLQHGTTIPTIQYEYVRMSLSFRRRGTLCSNQSGEIAWPQSLLWLVTSSIPQSGQKYRFLWSLAMKLAVELWITCLENPQLYCTHITLRPTKRLQWLVAHWRCQFNKPSALSVHVNLEQMPQNPSVYICLFSFSWH
jgi:hypothetical protein